MKLRLNSGAEYTAETCVESSGVLNLVLVDAVTVAEIAVAFSAAGATSKIECGEETYLGYDLLRSISANWMGRGGTLVQLVKE